MSDALFTTLFRSWCVLQFRQRQCITRRLYRDCYEMAKNSTENWEGIEISSLCGACRRVLANCR